MNKNILAAAVALLIVTPAAAEQSQALGNYVVHYNALNSTALTPEVARQYGIQRSKNRAILNVSVLRQVMGTTGEPVTAKVTGQTTNLSRQLQTLSPREVREGNAIYYLAEFAISDQEIMDFDIEVQPEGKGESGTVHFRQQFYTR
jgi:hypothetical protein